MRRFGYQRRAQMIGQRPSESALVEAILQTLNLMSKTFAFRMETNGAIRRDPDGGFRMVRNKGGRGKPDICFVTHGFGGFLEVKMPGRHAEPHQKIWMENAVGRGYAYAAVVHSVVEAQESLMELWKEKGMKIYTIEGL